MNYWYKDPDYAGIGTQFLLQERRMKISAIVLTILALFQDCFGVYTPLRIDNHPCKAERLKVWIFKCKQPNQRYLKCKFITPHFLQKISIYMLKIDFNL